jgi:hypothetical protein
MNTTNTVPERNGRAVCVRVCPHTARLLKKCRHAEPPIPQEGAKVRDVQTGEAIQSEAADEKVMQARGMILGY